MKTLILIIFVLFLVTFLSACGHRTVDVSFQPYVADFNADAVRLGHSKKADSLSIVFGKMDVAETCGQCHDGMITINKDCWDVQTDTERKITLYHEFGHCVLGKSHVETEDIMYPTRMNAVVFEGNADHYLERFFE